MGKLNQEVSFVVSEDDIEMGYKIVNKNSNYESPIYCNKKEICDLVLRLLESKEMSSTNAFELFMQIISLDLPNLPSSPECSGYYRINEERCFLDDVITVCEKIENDIVCSNIENLPGIGYFDELQGPFIRIYFKGKDENGNEQNMVGTDVYSLFQFEYELQRLTRDYDLNEADVAKLKYEIKEVILPETAEDDADFVSASLGFGEGKISMN
jgi:hypothetical protein